MSDSLPPVDYPVHRILQARILEWVAFPFFRASSQPRDRPRLPTLQADSLPAEPQGKPKIQKKNYQMFAKIWSNWNSPILLEWLPREIIWSIYHNLAHQCPMNLAISTVGIHKAIESTHVFTKRHGLEYSLTCCS